MADRSTTDTRMELLARAQQGEADAFEKLTAPLAPKLHSVARRVVGNREDAEDVVQESLWKAFQHLPEFRAERAAFSSWLTRITINQAVGVLRHRRSDPLHMPANTADHSEPRPAVGYRRPRSRTPEQICSLREMQQILRLCISRMDSTYRRFLDLASFEEWSNAEIAEELGVSVGTVKTRIHRARRMLRDRLQQPRYSGIGWGVVK